MRGSHRIATGLAIALLGLASAGLAEPAASPEPCAIKSQAASIQSVKIQPAGESSFLITLARVPVEATLISSTVASLHVHSPLRFTTEHSLNKLGVVTGKRVSLKEGRLVLARGLSPSFLAPADHDPKRSDAPMTLPLRELAPKSPLAIPCSALTVPGNQPQYAHTPELTVSNKPVLHATSSAAFPLYAKRKAERPWVITFHGPMNVVKRSGTWVKLRARWSDGSVLQGWSNSNKLSIQKSEPQGGRGGLGSLGMRHCGRSHRLRPIPYVLAANAPIHTRAKGAIWAHTAGVLKVEAFPLSRSDGWLQIAKIDGLPPAACSEHNKFWVHADHIRWTDTPI